MQKILIPVDSAGLSEKTLAMSTNIAQKLGTSILLLHVQQHFEPNTHPYAPITSIISPDVFDEISEKILQNSANKFAGTDLKVETRVSIGNPASEIIDIAMEENCDLIIMSTHGMNPVKRFLLGSVTNTVVHHATIPVLIVR